MKVSRKEGDVIAGAIKEWLDCGVIDSDEARKLSNAYQVIPFDLKRVAKYSFWIAISCLIISIFSVLADEWLIELFASLFNAPDAVKSIIFAAIAIGFYYIGIKRKRFTPLKIYSNEAFFFLGVVFTATSIAFFGTAIDSGTGHFSLLLLLATIIYGVLGLWFPSVLVWIFSLLSLGSWFGAETGYASGWGAYYLGMNYPLRFVLFALVLIVGGTYLFTHWQSKVNFLRPTRALGLLYLFVALWILSIFGNYGDPDIWLRAQQIELFHWSILFAVAAIAAIYHGVKYDDAMTRGFGLTFIFINLYTRYFEYFWEGTHKAIFFMILALSFWYLGARAEKIWQLSLVTKLTKQSHDNPK